MFLACHRRIQVCFYVFTFAAPILLSMCTPASTGGYLRVRTWAGVSRRAPRNTNRHMLQGNNQRAT
jgi:hypothetical protein